MKTRLFLLVGVSLLSGCAGVKKAPMPDMRHLIPVNQSVPDELDGHIPPHVIQEPSYIPEQAPPVVPVRRVHRRPKPAAVPVPASAPASTPAAAPVPANAPASTPAATTAKDKK